MSLVEFLHIFLCLCFLPSSCVISFFFLFISFFFFYGRTVWISSFQWISPSTPGSFPGCWCITSWFPFGTSTWYMEVTSWFHDPVFHMEIDKGRLELLFPTRGNHKYSLKIIDLLLDQSNMLPVTITIKSPTMCPHIRYMHIYIYISV